MSSPATNSLRRSFGNILTKISNRPSLEGTSEESKQPKPSSQPCYECSAKGKKNIQCRVCSKIACLLHSGVTSIGNNDRTCDECIHKMIVEEMTSYDELKEKIGSDIQDLGSKRAQMTIKLNKENIRALNLKNELKEISEKSLSDKKKLIEEISALQNENKKIEGDIQVLEAEIGKRKAIAEYDEKRVGDLEKEAEHMKIALDEQTRERTKLLANVTELRDFIRLQVPVRIIKKVVCSNCYISVQNAFAGMFKNVVPIKTEAQAKVQAKKSGACASCIIS